MGPQEHEATLNDALRSHWDLKKPWPTRGKITDRVPLADRLLLADLACSGKGSFGLLALAKNGSDSEVVERAASIRAS